MPEELELGQGWEEEMMSEEPQRPPPHILLLPRPVPGPSPVPPRPVGWGGVEGVGRGRVVCVSPKPGSCADESRLNGEPQAVLSHPTLTHLSPRSPNALT